MRLNSGEPVRQRGASDRLQQILYPRGIQRDENQRRQIAKDKKTVSSFERGGYCFCVCFRQNQCRTPSNFVVEQQALYVVFLHITN
ncbi:hypothetical protein J21TS3_27560 [Paenibacillus cookii]|uniref:Uncharacterized protein n=1 Tax=Paenibacillus cookii TaxID=157839 RepID=A0ABQ4LXD3_9BACL|nr:hypothetical protein J21TS3_27560 [Paenibacillus cookii]